MKVAIATLALGALLAACAPPLDAGADPGIVRPSNDPTPCRAERYQSYVGRNRSELPPKPVNETWRVTCTTCPVTMDYNQSRLNIFYEERTGVIREVKCG
ncbi:MAG TPA: I78 family peptidase inhibitor [Brevundimonas sp.]|nr:I78 family peptidase inhibitor [Brevundimonas sp.]